MKSISSLLIAVIAMLVLTDGATAAREAHKAKKAAAFFRKEQIYEASVGISGCRFSGSGLQGLDVEPTTVEKLLARKPKFKTSDDRRLFSGVQGRDKGSKWI